MRQRFQLTCQGTSRLPSLQNRATRIRRSNIYETFSRNQCCYYLRLTLFWKSVNWRVYMSRMPRLGHLFFLPTLFLLPTTAPAQIFVQAPTVITQTINNAKLVTIAGTTPRQASVANDLGAVPGSFPMEHLWLQLKRSAQQEQALETYLQQLEDPTSPNFHHWLTADQFGQNFGLAQTDIDTITQ